MRASAFLRCSSAAYPLASSYRSVASSSRLSGRLFYRTPAEQNPLKPRKQRSSPCWSPSPLPTSQVSADRRLANEHPRARALRTTHSGGGNQSIFYTSRCFRAIGH